MRIKTVIEIHDNRFNTFPRLMGIKNMIQGGRVPSIDPADLKNLPPCGTPPDPELKAWLERHGKEMAQYKERVEEWKNRVDD